MNEDNAHPVTVGVDGSAAARTAARWGALEAARRGVALRLVHGDVTALPSLPDIPGLGWPKEHQDEMRHAVRQRLAEAAADAVHDVPGLDYETVSIPGSPARVLIHEASAASLIVVGHRGLGGFDALLAGSVAVKVAAHAHSPVVVVRRSAGLSADSAPVVAGVDGSESTRAVLEHAFELAAAHAAPLHVVHTWQPAGIDKQALSLSGTWGEIQQNAERHLAELLAGWPDQYPDVDVQRFVGPGSPVVELLAQSSTAQLVVIGSRGRGALSGMLLGSTSHQLIHHSECPVMVVRS